MSATVFNEISTGFSCFLVLPIIYELKLLLIWGTGCYSTSDTMTITATVTQVIMPAFSPDMAENMDAKTRVGAALSGWHY